MAAFDGRARAFEGAFFRAEQKHAIERHLERLVKAGKLPESALATLAAAGQSAASSSRAHLSAAYQDVPTTVRNRHQGEWIYSHNKTRFPAPTPSAAENLTVGTRISLGRTRWSVEGASVFSVADGKRLAQEPVKDTSTPWERARNNRIRAATAETPLVGGYRLLPELTPGRALLWGSLLALWGTVATVKLTAKHLGIEKAEDTSSVLREVLAPYGAALVGGMEPLKEWMSVGAMSSEEVSQGELATKLRLLLGRTRSG